MDCVLFTEMPWLDLPWLECKQAVELLGKTGSSYLFNHELADDIVSRFLGRLFHKIRQVVEQSLVGIGRFGRSRRSVCSNSRYPASVCHVCLTGLPEKVLTRSVGSKSPDL